MCNFGHNAPKSYCYKYNIQDITTECQVFLCYDVPFCTSRFCRYPGKTSYTRCLTCNAFYVIASALPIWGPRGILCTRGEKAQTRKRVSVIVRDNVISKAQFRRIARKGTLFIKPTQDTCTCTCVVKSTLCA